MSELKACPFCGGAAKLMSYRVAEDAEACLIECQTCDARTSEFEDAYAPRADATAAWNRRAPVPTVTREELAAAMCEWNGNKCACSATHATTGWCFDGSWASGTTPVAVADAILARLREKGVVG